MKKAKRTRREARKRHTYEVWKILVDGLKRAALDSRNLPNYWEVKVCVARAGGAWVTTWYGSSPSRKGLSRVIARARDRIIELKPIRGAR